MTDEQQQHHQVQEQHPTVIAIVAATPTQQSTPRSWAQGRGPRMAPAALSTRPTRGSAPGRMAGPAFGLVLSA
jgi:hypothetical protein